MTQTVAFELDIPDELARLRLGCAKCGRFELPTTLSDDRVLFRQAGSIVSAGATPAGLSGR